PPPAHPGAIGPPVHRRVVGLSTVPSYLRPRGRPDRRSTTRADSDDAPLRHRWGRRPTDSPRPRLGPAAPGPDVTGESSIRPATAARKPIPCGFRRWVRPPRLVSAEPARGTMPRAGRGGAKMARK